MEPRRAARALLGGEGDALRGERVGAVEDLPWPLVAAQRVGIARRVRQPRVPDDVVSRLQRRPLESAQLRGKSAQGLDHAGAAARRGRRRGRWELASGVLIAPPSGKPRHRRPELLIDEIGVIVLRERREAAGRRREAGHLEKVRRRRVKSREHLERALGARVAGRRRELHESLEGAALERIENVPIDVLARAALKLEDAAVLGAARHSQTSLAHGKPPALGEPANTAVDRQVATC
mmetsp:Transcript_23285/g.68403  ORF Transcript_23285/g.68403 Transcript_23285/m.68403 type:complete len:236 (-) Transcript_23285:16-723(-)